MTFRFRHGLSLVIWGLLGASILLAQSRRPENLGVGKLLVVPRQSPDPSFAQTVVLLVHYAEDGTVGLVINRQTTLPVSSVLRDLKGSSKYSQPVYAGGPVQIEVVQALLQSHAGPQDAAHLFGNVYLVSKKVELEKAFVAGKGSRELRIYLGYCGWSRGQLENEVNQGGWYIFDGSEGIVFDSNPSTLWSRMIARTELDIARVQSRFDGRSLFGLSSSFTLSRPRGKSGVWTPPSFYASVEIRLITLARHTFVPDKRASRRLGICPHSVSKSGLLTDLH